jgi:hypothetical protein
MRILFERLFPERIDNTFPGHRLALYAFYLATALVLWRSQHHILAADGGAQSIATMPLDSYPAGAARNIIALFGQWGVSQIMLALVFLIACLRYRAMIPLLWLVVALEALGRQLTGMAKPIATITPAPGAVGNLPMLAFALAMLALSLWRPAERGGSSPE